MVKFTMSAKRKVKLREKDFEVRAATYSPAIRPTAFTALGFPDDIIDGSDNTDQPSLSLAAVLRHVMIDSNPPLTPLDTPDPPTTHAERRVPG